MILFLRANDLVTDPRAKKYLDYYRDNQIPYKAVCWNRSGEDIAYPEHYLPYKRKTENNLGKKAIFSRLIWILFVFRQIFKNRKDCSAIHACDFDTILAALPFRLFGKTVIFDIFDMFSYTIRTTPVIDVLISFLENVSIKLSSYVIICEEERIEQIRPFYRNPRTCILPNIPTMELSAEEFPSCLEIRNLQKAGNLVISYVGAFYDDRFLPEIMQAIKNLEHIVLFIAGFGDRKIEEYCTQMASTSNSIRYLGRIGYAEALAVMGGSDLLIGIYCTTNRNHLFAAPNKFYESLMLKTPLITNEGTALAAKVVRFDTGFVIRDNREELVDLLKRLKEHYSTIAMKSKNCERTWKMNYSTYVADFLKQTYAGMINRSQ